MLVEYDDYHSTHTERNTLTDTHTPSQRHIPSQRHTPSDTHTLTETHTDRTIPFLSFFLYPLGWHMLPSHANAEACLTGWPNA